MPKQGVGLGPIQAVFPRQLAGPAARVWHIFNQLKAFERFPPDRQEQLLSGQLNHLLEHARKYSPFWRQRLARRTPRAQRLREMLSEFPPLSREDLQSQFERLSAKFPARDSLRIGEASTSGSTGTPIKVERAEALYTPLYMTVALVTSAWHQLDPMKSLAVVMRKAKDNEKAPLGTPFNWFGPVGTGFSRSTKDREPPELYEYCAERKPSYIQCGPTLAMSWAQYAIENQRDGLRPEYLLATGSVVSDDMREIIRKGLGAKVIDRYSCEETGYIALQCPRHEHFHVLSPVTHVEIVDDYGAPCPVGKPGRVLLTSMQSYAMPILRYEIGDMAEWGEACDCGITLPVIKQVWGRTRQMITTPDGRRTYARIYARDFQDIPGLLAYRFVLHQNSMVVAQLKVRDSSADIAAAITAKVQQALSYPYPVRVRYVDEIDWGSSWKQEFFAVSDKAPP